MRWIVWISVIAGVGCDSGRVDKAEPAKPPSSAPLAPIDALQPPWDGHDSVGDVLLLPYTGLGQIGEAAGYGGSSPGVVHIELVGDYVYWSRIDNFHGTLVTSFRRIPRSGGVIEELGKVTAAAATRSERDFAVVDGVVYATGREPPTAALPDEMKPFTIVRAHSSLKSAERAPLFKLSGGKATVIGRGPLGTVASTNLTAYEGKLYWVAAGPTGDGPVMVTERSGATKTAVPCAGAAVPGCAELLPGPVPVVAGATLTLLGSRKRQLAAQCPGCTRPHAVLGEHVVCSAGSDDTCHEAAVLVHFDGKATPTMPGLGVDVQAAGGSYYHLGAAFSTGQEGLLRRSRPDGGDERVVPNASLFAVDDRGVAWLVGDQLYVH
jgi:hypothetical protein